MPEAKPILVRPDAASRRAHRERARRYRSRQRTGRLIVAIDFSEQETAKLCALRYLKECELEDRSAIGTAIHNLLANIVIDDPA